MKIMKSVWQERDEEIGSPTMHHDSDACTVKAVNYCVSVKSRELARETDRSITLHCHTD